MNNGRKLSHIDGSALIMVRFVICSVIANIINSVISDNAFNKSGI